MIDLHALDQAIAEQTEEENAGIEVAPEHGRPLAEHVLRILTSFEKATTDQNVVSAFNQVGIHSKNVDRVNIFRRVTYIDPSTARLIVEKYGVIPLPEPFRTAPPPTWQLKICDLNSRYQTEMAQRLRLELEAIRDELNPPEQRSFKMLDSPTGSVAEPPAAVAKNPPP